MKKIYLITLLISALALTGCIKETFPMSGTATAEQIGESPAALKAAMDGIPAQLSQGYLVYGYQNTEVDMAYPAMMIIYTESLGDMFVQGEEAGYDWYRSYNNQERLGPEGWRQFVPWRTLYMFVKSANDIIGAVKKVEEPSEEQKQFLGMGYAYRAWIYWHLWNMYLPVENIYTDVSAVKGLTVPIVKDDTPEEAGKNNPRVPEEEMYAFIMSDLDLAEECLANYTPTNKLFPSLAVVYGLKARAYLSKEDYANAATYARKAIDASGCTPLTQAQWEDPNSGFCDVSSQNSWMWHVSYSAESMGNLCNFTGWMAGEADWGYNALCNMGINRWLYDRLSDTDFRKHSFIDPKGFEYYNYKLSRPREWLGTVPPYTSIKFRCKGGDWANYAVGGANDLPVMRVEEMYLIEAEALGVGNLSAGKTALEKFMKTYRDPAYFIPETVTDLKTFQEEVIFQKRIEFWGEGIAFFDAKRLRLGSYQAYPGTNAPGEVFMLNAEGIKPGWNFVIPNAEVQHNNALKDKNNPDPTGTILPVKL